MSDAKERELCAWGESNVFGPAEAGNLSESVVDTRWVLLWKMVEGEIHVKAHLAGYGS